jgi:hypothetical protein
MIAKIVSIFQVMLRSRGAETESATTIGTHVLQNLIRARSAERAFIAANHGFVRIWRQFPVTVLTARSQLKHVYLQAQTKQEYIDIIVYSNLYANT